jgi:hypothetical protein
VKNRPPIAGAPLHVKTVPELSLEEIENFADVCDEEGKFLVQRLRQLKLFISDKAFCNLVHPSTIRDRPITSRLSAEEFAQCVQAGILRPLPRCGPRPLRYAKIFKVGEPKKSRNRLVVHPALLNEEQRAHYAFDQRCELCDERAFFTAIASHRGHSARQFDLSCGFYQVPLAVNLSQYYAVRGPSGSLFAWQRLPMGLSIAPELMQIVLRILAKAATSHSEAHSTTTLCFVDNVIVFGPPSQVDRWATSFQNLCSRASVTLNVEAANDLHQRGTFCGRGFDLSTGCTFIPEKTKEKLHDLLPILYSQSILSTNDLASIFGSLIYSSRNVGLPLCQYYYPMKMFRVFSSKFRHDRNCPQFRLWESARRPMISWVFALLECGDIDVSDMLSLCSSSDAIIFTDATLTGFGAVLLLPDGSVRTLGREFHLSPHRRPPSINELELRAARYALAHWNDLLIGRHVFLGIDNTSALHALRSGNSRSYHLAQEATRITTSAASLSLSYVTSISNPADELSRGSPLNYIKLDAAARGLTASGNVRHHLCWSIGWSRQKPVLDLRRATAAGISSNG